MIFGAGVMLTLCSENAAPPWVPDQHCNTPVLQCIRDDQVPFAHIDKKLILVGHSILKGHAFRDAGCRAEWAFYLRVSFCARLGVVVDSGAIGETGLLLSAPFDGVW